MRRGGRGCRYSANPGLSLPADRFVDRCSQNRAGGQREKRPIPGAVGHEECRGKNHRRRQSQRARHRAWRLVRLQHARLGHARVAGAGAARRAGDLRRNPFGTAARREGTSSGGERAFVPVLARAAVAVGVAGLFIETHQNPDKAPSDGPNMMPLKAMEPLLARLMEFDVLAKAGPKRPAEK